MRRTAASCLVIAAAAAGCGGERTFDAQEFVDEANSHGAGLELGEPLSATGSDIEVYGVELASSATQVHGGGSLAVAEDPEGGEAEYARCEGAVDLICYRAANVVLRLEEITPEQQAQLDETFRELED